MPADNLSTSADGSKRRSKKLDRPGAPQSTVGGEGGTRAAAQPASRTSASTATPAAEASAPLRINSPYTNATGPVTASTKHAVIAATLANAELAAAKASSELYYDRFKITDDENEKLRGDLARQEVDSLVVIRYLEQQLVAALEDASAFKQSVADRLARQAEAERAVTEHYEELLRERDRSMADLSALVGRLQDDLRQASRYVQQRQEHQQELLGLRNAMEELVMAHERETAAMRFQNVDRKMKLIALERTLREDFQNMVEQESKRLLEAKHSALLLQNRSLEADKVGLVRDMEELLNLTSKINTERTNLKRVSELHKSAHEEVLRHTVARNRQGREVELKTQRLEERVRRLTAENQATKTELKAAYEGRVQELEGQLATALHTCEELQKELRSVRGLAQRVVAQRTDLEKFFHVALADCRRYRTSATAATATVRGSPVGGAGGTVGAATSLTPRPPPPSSAKASSDTFRLTQATLAESSRRPAAPGALPGPSAGTSTPVVPLPPVGRPAARTEAPAEAPPPAAAGAYIDEMSWEDKEKVIKALLFYINATYYSAPPSTATA